MFCIYMSNSNIINIEERLKQAELYVNKLISKELDTTQLLYEKLTFNYNIPMKSCDLTQHPKLKNPKNVLIFLITTRYTTDEKIRTLRTGLLWYLQRSYECRRQINRFQLAQSIVKLSGEKNMYAD